ncbi:MAG: glycosyltransferase family 4 protein [Candidatus Aminicenantales bacterium]|jgi:glycosyltransferase involved in cell wall biosynthesis
MIIHQFRPILSGAELQAERLAMKLVRRGHAIQVLTQLRDPGSITEEKLGGVRVRRVTFPLAYWMDASVKETFRYLVGEEQSYDILHVHQAFGHAVAAVLAARFLGKPCVIKIACAGDFGDLAVFSKFAGFERGLRILRHADAMIAISSEVAEDLRRWGFSEQRILRIPNGVDTAAFRRKRPLSFSAAVPARFILLGRRTPQKGIDVALRAVRFLSDRGWNRNTFEVVFHGLDYPAHDYKSMAHELGVTELVEFRPSAPNIKDVLQNAQAFILPSRGEGLSNALLEALAMEMPVVASRVSGTTDVITDGVDGWLIPPDSPEALAEAMESVLQDPARAAARGRKGRIRVKQEFSLDKVADRYSELYTRLTCRRGSKRGFVNK